MMTLRTDSFASRLTAAQQEELFNALTEGLSLREAAIKIAAWCGSSRSAPPSRSSICKWYQRTKDARWRWEQVEAGLEHLGAEEKARRVLLRLKYLCVEGGLEPREVAAFERIELQQRRLELEERKLEYALLKDDRRKAEVGTRNAEGRAKAAVGEKTEGLKGGRAETKTEGGSQNAERLETNAGGGGVGTNAEVAARVAERDETGEAQRAGFSHKDEWVSPGFCRSGEAQGDEPGAWLEVSEWAGWRRNPPGEGEKELVGAGGVF